MQIIQDIGVGSIFKHPPLIISAIVLISEFLKKLRVVGGKCNTEMVRKWQFDDLEWYHHGI